MMRLSSSFFSTSLGRISSLSARSLTVIPSASVIVRVISGGGAGATGAVTRGGLRRLERPPRRNGGRRPRDGKPPGRGGSGGRNGDAGSGRCPLWGGAVGATATRGTPPGATGRVVGQGGGGVGVGRFTWAGSGLAAALVSPASSTCSRSVGGTIRLGRGGGGAGSGTSGTAGSSTATGAGGGSATGVSTSVGGVSASSAPSSAGVAVCFTLTSRGGGSGRAAGLAGSAALAPPLPVALRPLPLAGRSLNMGPLGSERSRSRDSRSTNWRATTSSIVLDALLPRCRDRASAAPPLPGSLCRAMRRL